MMHIDTGPSQRTQLRRASRPLAGVHNRRIHHEHAVETGRSGVSRRSGRDRGVNCLRRTSIFVRLMAARWQSIAYLLYW